MDSIQDAREHVADLARQIRNLIDKTPASDWTPDKQAEHDRLVDEHTRAENRVAAMQASIERDPERSGDIIIAGPGDDGATLDTMHEHWLRGGFAILNTDELALYQAMVAEPGRAALRSIMGAQATTPGAAGGYLTSPEHSRTLLERMKAFGGMRAVAQVVATSTGNQIDWPTVDETSQMGEIIAENAAANDQDIAFGSEQDQTVGWFENNGSESFTKHTLSTTANRASSSG